MSDVWSFSLLIDSFSFSSIYWLVVVVLCSFLFSFFFGIVWHFNWTSIELWWWRWRCYRLYNHTSSFFFCILHTSTPSPLEWTNEHDPLMGGCSILQRQRRRKRRKEKKEEEEGEKYTSDSPKGPRREQSPSKFLLFFSFFLHSLTSFSSVIMTIQFTSTSCHLLLDQTNNKHWIWRSWW